MSHTSATNAVPQAGRTMPSNVEEANSCPKPSGVGCPLGISRSRSGPSCPAASLSPRNQRFPPVFDNIARYCIHIDLVNARLGLYVKRVDQCARDGGFQIQQFLTESIR